MPVIDGMLLIMLRPFPGEVFDANSLLSGAEMWLITGLMLLGWMRSSQRAKLLFSSTAITHLAAILILSFFFTYLYNMGLVVRQRLQVFPAILALLAIPYLASQVAVRVRPNVAPVRRPQPVRARQPRPRAARGNRPLERAGA
jgi:hypothetical protein